MRLENLMPTHNSLREPKSVMSIYEDIQNGTFVNKEPCSILRIGNNDEYYIGNGHHRLKAAHLLGIQDTHDLPFEIQVKSYSYDDLMSVNFAVGYCTPYDPRYECRKPNFLKYKNTVMYLLREWGYERALNYICEYRKDYIEPRTVYTIGNVT